MVLSAIFHTKCCEVHQISKYIEVHSLESFVFFLNYIQSHIQSSSYTQKSCWKNCFKPSKNERNNLGFGFLINGQNEPLK